MTPSKDLYHELMKLIAEKSSEILGKQIGSSSRFKEFDTKVRMEGILFDSSSPEFDEKNSRYVPELKLVFDFLTKAKKIKPTINSFGFLDYHLPPDFYNALYIALGNPGAFKVYAERLETLYKGPYKRTVDGIVFDSNKMMILNNNFTTFIISRDKNADPKHFCHEYFISMPAFQQALQKVCNNLDIPSGADDVAKYVTKLISFYDAVKQKYRNVFKQLKPKCSQNVRDAIQKMIKKPEQEVGGIKYENIPAAFLTYLCFVETITPRSWREYIYYPCCTVVWPRNKWGWIGGILVPYTAKTSREDRIAFQSAIVPLVSTFYLGYTHAILNESYLRSAVAAIMARNMSHLLGSHIEPGIQNDLFSFVKTVSTSVLLQNELSKLVSGSGGNQANASLLTSLLDTITKKGWDSAFKEAENHGDKKKLLGALYLPLNTIYNHGWAQAFKDFAQRSEYSFLKLLYQVQEKALARYALYRQRRMDFIARVATEWPAWGAGYDFYMNFVRPFIENSILLHFIGYSDGVYIDKIGFQVYIDDKEVTEIYTPNASTSGGSPASAALSNKPELAPKDIAIARGAVESEGRAKYPSRFEDYEPVTIWSRGGDMAVQAFHIVLENIIRNSIKHSLREIKEQLNIRMKLFKTHKEFSNAVGSSRLKNSDELLYVVISSEADKADEAEKLDKKICEPVIKETGEREPENWGMKEVKIAAAFLAGRTLEESNSDKPDFVQICSVKFNDKEYLGYCLVIPRFYYAGILEQGEKDANQGKR